MRHPRIVLALLAAFGAAGSVATAQTKDKPANPLVTALCYAHTVGDPDMLKLGNDKALKAALILATKDPTAGLTWDSAKTDTDRRVLKAALGGRLLVSAADMERIVQASVPASRNRLVEKVRAHADLLTTQFDMVDERYHGAATELAAWVAANYRPGKPLGVVVVCTGNTRRSVLGSTMGNVAAAYYGLEYLRFYSGGTKPSAINPRTLTALKEIGVEVEATGKEVARGFGAEPNPVYRIRWGNGMEATEFSKLYGDAQNPQQDFAAILVCGEADESCPTVRGASKRIPTPYQDPKVYDGAPFEAAKYAERRDDIGRFMMSAVMQGRRIIEVGKGK
jgi:arsenate reductase (thioredoxin)